MSAPILIVDDDPKILEVVGVSLSRRGYDVHTAGSGGEALERAATANPELVILDLGLPDMSGMQLLARMRETADVPVLFLSAESGMNARVAAIKSGAEDFLVKPVSLPELHAKVENSLKRRAYVRTLGERNQLLEAEVAQETERSRKEFKRHILSMRTLLAMSHDLNRAMQTDELVKVAALTLLGELKVSSMALFGMERESDARLRILGVKGFEAKRFEGLTIDRAAPFVELLEEMAGARRIARNPDQSLLKSLPDLRLAVFEYATPIMVRGEMKGIVFTGPKLSGDDYNDHDLDIITIIANSVGIGLENAHLLTQLQTSYVSTLRSLISIIEAKDPYTKGHTERVASYAVALAGKMGLPDDDLKRIMFAALMHDIGKMGVLDEIVNKPGALTDEEWALMREHPVTGARIVEKMEFLTGTADIVRHHHEAWNGRGYPDGLQGDDIPLGARIVTVADSFDAMTTDRPYRKALTVDEAIARLEESAGVQFDAELVKTFIAYIREKGAVPAPATIE
ncbi:MAG TPA: HD domain-containing phosphohydrolase [Candidatus Krumholzibacteria bacterium]|nr:HD domain-containing phosphohydrolase [Candidatus Krumholzibacteria bacterium]